jgi:hypothetical protein
MKTIVGVYQKINSYRTKGGSPIFWNNPEAFAYLLEETILNLVRGINDE